MDDSNGRPHIDWRTCSLCEREVPAQLITLHHLKPRQKGGTAADRTPLCKPCHKQLHATFSNTELAKRLDSIAALRRAAPLELFLKWIRKQRPDRNFATHISRQRRASSSRGRPRH